MSRVTRAALAFALASAVARPSYAQEALALDAAAANAASSGNWGFNLDARVGYRTALFPRSWPVLGMLYGLIFQFELIGGYRQIFVDTGDLHIGRLGGGVRIGGSIDWLQILGFFHYSAADANGTWGLLFDIGAAVDYRFKTWSLGVHYAHDRLHLNTRTDFNDIGAHVEVRGFWL